MNRWRRISACSAIAITAAGLCAACADPVPRSASPAPAISTVDETVAATPAMADAKAPTRVRIPQLGLDEPLIPLGIEPDGSMEVPADAADVGWLTTAGRPGSFGPTVLAGHVDSVDGPGVFFHLFDLAPGAEITVLTTAGTAVRYRVTRVEDHLKKDFPTERVFGATLDDELRLITCGGEFDPSERSYRSNRIVFAAPVGTQTARLNYPA